MTEFDDAVARGEAMRRAERRNQLRPIEVREPVRYPEDSAGVEVVIEQSPTISTVLDLSRREAIDLVEKLQAYLDGTGVDAALAAAPGPWHAAPSGIRMQRVLASGEVEIERTRYGTKSVLSHAIANRNRREAQS